MHLQQHLKIAAFGAKLSAPPDVSHFQSSRFEWLAGPPVMLRVKGTTEWRPPREIDEPLDVGQLEDGEKVYVLSKATTNPKPLKTPDPGYPEGERSAGHEGIAELLAVVDKQGLIHSVAVSSGDPAFQVACLGALRHWRFGPARLAGLPVAVTINIEIKFRLY
jgi:TonB family protein